MQKDSFLQSNPPIVEFSKLDENNKAQFLQFLIKNNITFDNASGKDNVIAKVTLKTLKPLKNPNKLTQSQNNETKKMVQKQDPKNNKKKLSYSDKENNENYHEQNKKKLTTETSKSPLKNKTFTTISASKTNNNNKNTTSPSPFKQINLGEKSQAQKASAKKSTNDLSISMTSNPNVNKQQKQSVMTDSKLKQKTPERKLYAEMPISPVKSTQKPQEKSITYRQSSTTPIKSEKSFSYKKESHEQLSNFRKMNNLNLKTTFTHLEPSTKSIKTKPSKQKVKEKSIQKVRDKVPISKSSRQNLISKEKTLSLCSSNQQTLSFHKNQSFQVQERIQLVNKYKEYFSNFTSLNVAKNNQSAIIKQRPVCWPLNQVEKFLDQFYDDNFAKNTNQILHGSKKFNESLSKGPLKTSHIVQSLQKYFNKKFNKVQKAIQYNLINLLYSIAFYINESQQSSKQLQQQNCSFISLKMFESFLTQKYELQDYLFFLFCRNILKQDFKKCLLPTVSKSMINKKEIDKFLKQIVGQNNTQILEEYHHMIFKMIPTYDIEVNSFMKIIVKDYRIKRETAERIYKEKIKVNKSMLAQMQHTHEGGIHQNDPYNDDDSSLQNTFNRILNIGQKNGDKLFDNQGHIIREDSMEELTFGEETKEILMDVQMHQKHDLDGIVGPNYLFWESPYINKRNQHIEKQRFLNDQFNQMVTEKLCQKTVELIEILSLNGTTKFKSQKLPHHQNPNLSNSFQQNNNEDSQSQEQEESEIHQVQQLLFSKALCMFFTVVEMNKVKWLKELHITNPTQEDIEKVEEIQLFFRKIKQYPTAKDIAEFCKLILTVTQITQELSKFFV